MRTLGRLRTRYVRACVLAAAVPWALGGVGLKPPRPYPAGVPDGVSAGERAHVAVDAILARTSTDTQSNPAALRWSPQSPAVCGAAAALVVRSARRNTQLMSDGGQLERGGRSLCLAVGVLLL